MVVRSAGAGAGHGNVFLENEDVDVLDEYEGVPAESMEELVEDVCERVCVWCVLSLQFPAASGSPRVDVVWWAQSGPALAAAIVKVVQRITSTRVLRYTLTIAEDLLLCRFFQPPINACSYVLSHASFPLWCVQTTRPHE